MKQIIIMLTGGMAGAYVSYYMFNSGILVGRPYLTVFMLAAFAAICLVTLALAFRYGLSNTSRQTTHYYLLFTTSLWLGLFCGLLVIRLSVFYTERLYPEHKKSDGVMEEISVMAKDVTDEILQKRRVSPPDTVLHSLKLEAYKLPVELLNSTNRLDERVNTYLYPLDEHNALVVISPVLEWYDPQGRSPDLPAPAQLTSMASFIALVELNDELEIHGVQKIEGMPLVRSMLFDPTDDTLVVSSIKLGSNCLTLEVHRLNISMYPLNILGKEQVFETQPCLSHHMAAHQHGARLAKDVGGSILLSIGDFRLGPDRVHQGLLWNGRPAEMQWPNSYGMIVRLHGDGNHDIISTGHRNPQGLTVDSNTGTIWSTEHGPKGGDELNRIVQGADYGWPDVTYGVPYDYPPMPEGEWASGRWSNHDGFEAPKFAWLPAIGTSQLLVYYGDEFPAWHGDLLIGTLSNQSLRRIRMDSGQVKYDERIQIGHRIRDIAADPSGRLLMTTDDGYLLRLSNAHD